MTRLNEEELKEMLKKDIQTSMFLNQNSKSKRTPYYGVTVTDKIKKVQVNNRPVDNVIEYRQNGNIFYIWYFKDLKLKDDFKISFS